jgi:hypothetical protein
MAPYGVRGSVVAFFERTPRPHLQSRGVREGLFRRPVAILTVYDVSSHFILGNNQVLGDCFLALIFFRHACAVRNQNEADTDLP